MSIKHELDLCPPGAELLLKLGRHCICNVVAISSFRIPCELPVEDLSLDCGMPPFFFILLKVRKPLLHEVDDLVDSDALPG